MKYYIDTEFLEGPQSKRILGIKTGQTKPTIDLISIGIVSGDNREYYAISKDFNLREAWNRYQMKQVSGDMRNRYPEGVREYWIRENVLKPIFNELAQKLNDSEDYIGWVTPEDFNYSNIKSLINRYGKSNTEIASEIKTFASPDEKRYNEYGEYTSGKPQFYAYYADYDWVAFCWLFGLMIDLPEGFPMYCIDLKQELERKRRIFNNKTPNRYWTKLEEQKLYPENLNEHNALDDARWNRKLHHFILNIDKIRKQS